MKKYEKFRTGDVYSVVSKGTIFMPSPCLVWIRSTAPSGRPIMKSGGITKVIYRVLWEAENGEIPANMTIDHTCQNKRCLNLDHLELVSEDENGERARRMDMDYSNRKSNTQAIKDVTTLMIEDGLITPQQLEVILKKYGEAAPKSNVGDMDETKNTDAV